MSQKQLVKAKTLVRKARRWQVHFNQNRYNVGIRDGEHAARSGTPFANNAKQPGAHSYALGYYNGYRRINRGARSTNFWAKYRSKES